MNTQFAEKTVDVGLDRAFGDRQLFANLFVAVSVNNQLENISFADGQFRGGNAFSQFGRHLWRDTFMPGMNRANGVQ